MDLLDLGPSLFFLPSKVPQHSFRLYVPLLAELSSTLSSTPSLLFFDIYHFFMLPNSRHYLRVRCSRLLSIIIHNQQQVYSFIVFTQFEMRGFIKTFIRKARLASLLKALAELFNSRALKGRCSAHTHTRAHHCIFNAAQAKRQQRPHGE